jgi:hypothetical protein
MQFMIFLMIIIVIIIIVWVVIHMQRSRPRCPRCGALWRKDALGCLVCKYSPYLPPDHVPIDDGKPLDTRPIVYTQFEGDKTAPWIRRNF